MAECTGLVASDIVVRFGGLVALEGATVEGPPGWITALIGPNGAGKTTMFNVCSGFQTATEGTVILDGADITGLSPARRARLGVGRTFQRMELFGSLTVRENIELAHECRYLGDDPLTQLGIARGGRKVRREAAAVAGTLIELVGLGEVEHQLAGEISTGQGRLVELTRTLAHEPRILLLDEPSSGLDHAESHGFGEVLRRVVAEQGIGILMVEHDMSLVLNISDWIFVLDFGKPLMAGTADDIRNSAAVRDAYLGKTA